MKKFNKPVLIFLFLGLVIGISQVNAWTNPINIASFAYDIMQNDGVWFCDESTDDCYYAGQDTIVNNVRDIAEVQNDSLDWIILDTTADVTLYEDANRGGLQIKIQYLEGDSSLTSCSYQMQVGADKETDWVWQPCSNVSGSIVTGQVEGETVFAVSLKELCFRDDNQDGSCGSDFWRRYVSGFNTSSVGEDSLMPPPLDTSGSESQEPAPMGLAQKIQNLYTWAVSLAGLVALGIIIFGGVLYASSAGNPSRITEAKSWITHAFLGLGMLFGAYLILGFINPNLTKLEDIFLEVNVNPQSQGLELGGGAGGGGGASNIPYTGPPTPGCGDNGCTYEEFAAVARSFAVISPPEVHGDHYPTNDAHLRYIAAEPTLRKDPGNCYGADCGVYVATVMINTIDSSFPPRGTYYQGPYLEDRVAEGLYERIVINSTADLEPGDILLDEGYESHIALWLDDGEYEAGWLGGVCGSGYMPRGPRSSFRSDAWLSYMTVVFRYKGF